MKYLFLLFATLLAASCTEDDELTPLDQLPPATQTGENIVACLIDGEPWVNDPNRTGEVNISASYYEMQDAMQIITFSGEYGTSRGSVISLIISPPNTGLSNLESNSLRYTSKPQTEEEVEYFLNVNDGAIEVTNLDVESRILSGRFYGQLFSSSTTDTLRITDGRFDVTFY